MDTRHMSETIDNGKPIREMAGEVLSLSRRHPPASDVAKLFLRLALSAGVAGDYG
jgi:hypothetical protein